MKIRLNLILATLVLAVASRATLAADPNVPDDRKAPTTAPDVAKAILPSLVRVEIATHYDRGEVPHGGAAWPGTHNDVGYETLIKEERPAEAPGWLIAPDRVLCPDMMIHPRFLGGIKIRQGSQLVDAKVIAYAKQQEATLLQLDKPLDGAKPIDFVEGGGKGPYTGFTFSQDESDFVIHPHPVPPPDTTERGERWLDLYFPCLIVDASGHPVGLSFNEFIPADEGAWKIPPAKWEMLTEQQHAALIETIGKVADQRALAVTINLRSPTAAPQQDPRYSPRPAENDDATVRHALGVLMEDGETILVLAELKPKVTARIERIMVQPASGAAINAKFVASLSDYGALVAKLEKSLPSSGAQARTLGDADLRPLRERLLPAAEILLQGEARVAHVHHRRIAQYAVSWRRNVYPILRGQVDNVFLFDDAGTILALPVLKRAQVSIGEDRPEQNVPVLTSAAQIRAALADLKSNSDPANVPLGEEQENRLAWLGVELQPLNQELAQANKVSEMTSNGATGAVVTYVYPDSPAAKAGIEAGAVFLRLHVPGEPKPLDVHADQYTFSDQPFPWDRLDQVPEQYFERIPQPWPSAENSFTRALTDLGMGTKYALEYAVDGKITRKEFDVVQSPTHFASAPRFKSDALGMTVRDMTFEVRRYMQCSPQDPGVVISRIEAGSKASVSGLKPYEIITHINDKPVNNIEDLQKLIKGQQELRLSVKRMSRGRIVKIQLPAAEAKTTTKSE